MNVHVLNAARSLFLAALVLLLTTATVLAQSPTVLTPTRTDVRVSLVTPVTTPEALPRAIPPHESKEDIFARLRGPAPVGPVDTAVQSAPGTLGAPTILSGFEGLGNLSGALPPDSDGGIGINHYVEWVNLKLAIYSRTGTLVYGPVDGNTLFAGFGGPCETQNDGEPVVLYDQLAHRWFVSQFAVSTSPPGSLCIAVSDGPNPVTSSWYRYEYPFAPVFPNLPKYGIWDDMYTMTFQGFTGPTFNYTGLRLGAFDRTALLAGNPTAQLQFFNADTMLSDAFFGALPPRVQGPANVAPGTPAPFIHIADGGWFGGSDRYTVLELDVDFVTPANTTLTRTDLVPAPFDQNLCNGSRNCIPQPGTTARLEAFGGHTLFQAPGRDLDPTGGLDLRMLAQAPVDVNGADRAGIRWIELQNTGGGWSIRQQSTFAPADGRHRWMGSIAMNGAGDIALGYSVSDGTSTFPAIWATGRLTGDPLNTMAQGETVLRAGVGSQTSASSRWGDYAVTNVDPVDDHSFWHINEYLASTASANWATYISHFQLSPLTRYVATTGNDTGNICTNPASPCRTIGHAVIKANPGDILNIAAGTYTEPGLRITKALNIVAAGVVIE